MSTQIIIEIRDGDTIVKRFVSTGMSSSQGVKAIVRRGMGWLQAWSDPLSEDQWRRDCEWTRKQKQDVA